MDSYQTFYKTTFVWNRTMMKWLGHDMYDENFKLNIISYLLYAYTFFMLIIIIYTDVVSDHITRLNSIFYLALFCQALFKIYNSRYHLDFLKMISFIESLFKMHIKSESYFRQQLFERFAFYTDLIAKIGGTLYMGSVILFMPYPIYMYYVHNERVPLILVYLPGIDESTLSGYIILICWQLFTLFIATIGLTACDSFYALLICNVPICARLIEDEVNHFNVELTENPKDSPKCKQRFRNIMLMHKEMKIYISDLDEIFFKICFVQIFTCTLSAVVLLYTVIDTQYFPSLVLGISVLGQIFAFCTFGNVIVATNEITSTAIDDINWYLMGVEQQRKYQHLLMHVQNPCYLTIGGVIPLNWPTCVNIFKQIYYALNLLVQMR